MYTDKILEITLGPVLLSKPVGIILKSILMHEHVTIVFVCPMSVQSLIRYCVCVIWLITAKIAGQLGAARGVEASMNFHAAKVYVSYIWIPVSNCGLNCKMNRCI